MQAIPLFTREHGAFEYFRDHKVELDAMTGDHIVVVLPQVLMEEPGGKAWAAPDSKRYEGLRYGDLPCLWLEDSQSHFVIPLPSEQEQISRLFARITDAAKTARSAKQMKISLDLQTALHDGKAVRVWAIGSFFLVAFLLIGSLISLLFHKTGFWIGIAAVTAIEVTYAITIAAVLRSIGDLSERRFLGFMQLAFRSQLEAVTAIIAGKSRAASHESPGQHEAHEEEQA